MFLSFITLISHKVVITVQYYILNILMIVFKRRGIRIFSWYKNESKGDDNKIVAKYFVMMENNHYYQNGNCTAILQY